MQDQNLRDLVRKMSSDGYSKDDIGRAVQRYNQKKTEPEPSKSKFDWKSKMSPHIRGFNADEESPEELDKVSEFLFEPKTDFFSRQAAKTSEPMLRHSESNEPNRMTTFPVGPVNVPIPSKTLGRYGGAFIQSVGKGLDSLTSPGNVAMLGAGAVRNTLGQMIPRSRMPLADKLRKMQGGADVALKTLGAPVVAGGIDQISEGEHIDEKLLGALQVLMGGMAMKNRQPTQGGVTIRPEPTSSTSAFREPKRITGAVDDVIDAEFTSSRSPSPSTQKQLPGEIIEIGGRHFEIVKFDARGKPQLRPIPPSEVMPPDLPEKDWGRTPDEVLPPEGNLPELVSRFGESIGRPKPETVAKVDELFPGLQRTESSQIDNLQDPNLHGGEGNPELAGSIPYHEYTTTPDWAIDKPAKSSKLSKIKESLDRFGKDDSGEADPEKAAETIRRFMRSWRRRDEMPDQVMRPLDSIDNIPDAERGIGSRFPGDEPTNLSSKQPIDLNAATEDLTAAYATRVGRGVSPEIAARIRQNANMSDEFDWPDFHEDGRSERMFNATEGPEIGSTLSETTLRQRGTPIPERAGNEFVPDAQPPESIMAPPDSVQTPESRFRNMTGDESLEAQRLMQEMSPEPSAETKPSRFKRQPDTYEIAKRNLDERQDAGQIVDYEDELSSLKEQHGVIDTMSNETSSIIKEIMQANDEGYVVIPKGGKPFGSLIRTLSDGSAVVDPKWKSSQASKTKPSLFKRIMKAGDDFARDETGSIDFGDKKPKFSRSPKKDEKLTQFRKKFMDDVKSRIPDAKEQHNLDKVITERFKSFDRSDPKAQKTLDLLRAVRIRNPNSSTGRWSLGDISPETIQAAQQIKELAYGKLNMEIEDIIDNYLETGRVELPDPKYDPNMPQFSQAPRTDISEMRVPGTGKPARQVPTEDKLNAEEFADLEMARADDDFNKLPGKNRHMLEDEFWENLKLKYEGTPDNIAMGGADPEVLDVLGTSLYASNRPEVVTRELLQNSGDEMKEIGSNAPIRVAFSPHVKDSKTGNTQHVISFKDFGRGMTLEKLYTIFSDVGKSGKRGIQSASGGFGFAKAAPFLATERMKVESITKENGRTVKYTFDGKPADYKNQTVGVPIQKQYVPDNTPTGLRIDTYFPTNKTLTGAQELLEETVTSSPEMKNVQSFKNYGDISAVDGFLQTGKDPTGKTDTVETFNGLPIPPKVDTISTPTADVDVHYELDNKERVNAKILYLNNGLFALKEDYFYGMHPVPNVPNRIILDIKSKVPEGQEGYPFVTNREGLNRDLRYELRDWIQNNITKQGEQQRRNELQKVFDDLQPEGKNKFVVLDSGGKYTPAELNKITNGPVMHRIADVMEDILSKLAVIFANEPYIETTVKFGFRIADANKGGVNIPNPRGNKTNAILINPLGAIQFAKTPREAAARMVHIIAHEFNHNLEKNEGAGFTWSFAEVLSKLDPEDQLNARNFILDALTQGTGNYVAEVQELLQDYAATRGRADTTVDLLSREAEISNPASKGQRGVSFSNKPNGKGTPKKYLDRSQVDESLPINKRAKRKINPPGVAEQIWNFKRGMMAVDLPFITSAAFRQASPLAWTRAWWKSWIPSVKAYGEEAIFAASENEIRESKYFRPRYHPKYNKKGELVGYVEAPSIAEEMGIKLADLDDLTGREEHIRATIAEKIPIYGKFHVRGSNRAYVAFLNNLRRYRLEDMMNQAEFAGVENDMPVMKQIGEFLNDATGRSTLKTKVTPNKELNIEVAGRALSLALWSPRLLWSRIRMLNPMTYTKMDNRVRKEYAKSMLRVAANWWGFAGLLLLAKEALNRDDIEVSLDPTSADFGKAKIGDTRIDTGAGFQQFLVAAARFAAQKTTSSATNKTTQFSQGYNPRTSKTLFEDFATSKLHPEARLAYDLLNVSSNRPVHFWDRQLQGVLPLMVQDIFEIMEEEPGLALTLAPLVSSGVGSNTYGSNKKFGDPAFTDSIEDYLDLDRRSISGTIKKWW